MLDGHERRQRRHQIDLLVGVSRGGFGTGHAERRHRRAGLEDVGDRQADGEGDRRVQHRPPEQPARRAAANLRRQDRVHDGEEEQRRRRGLDQLNDQASDLAEPGHLRAEPRPDRERDEHRDEDLNVQRNARPLIR